VHSVADNTNEFPAKGSGTILRGLSEFDVIYLPFNHSWHNVPGDPPGQTPVMKDRPGLIPVGSSWGLELIQIFVSGIFVQFLRPLRQTIE